ncbi:hypothetical protein QFZ83_004822 [Variovorax sp. W1I1]|uniref:Ish1 domain-containing protein n=1 Tax=Variovorax sp. W1I1 TaxID=3042309 RepID=UPI0027858ED6|nr:Ish1 domain-containing protein [Variovorax sp. W1I1]MDQ0610651.1 hypothetical protein [Variovorax sp. W1I1]
MGILYTVWPLDSDMKEWLRSQDIAFPDASSRWPTREEVVKTLRALRGFRIRYTENGPGKRWDADITEGQDGEWWTLLHAEPKGDADLTTEISFEKGESALIIAILRDLSAATGPLVLMADVGGPPLVVSQRYSFAALVQELSAPEEDEVRWRRLLENAPGAASTH